MPSSALSMRVICSSAAADSSAMSRCIPSPPSTSRPAGHAGDMGKVLLLALHRARDDGRLSDKGVSCTDHHTRTTAVQINTFITPLGSSGRGGLRSRVQVPVLKVRHSSLMRYGCSPIGIEEPS